MRKKLLIVALALVVLGIAGVVVLGLSLDKVIQQAVVRGGTAITKVDVALEQVTLSLLNGEGSLRGFSLGNPEGYESPSSIEFGMASLALQPSSLLSDKVIIRHLRLEDPVITFEGGLRGNNLNDLLKGMQSDEKPPGETAEDTGSAPEEDAAERGFQVDELSLTGAKVQVRIRELGGQTQTLVVPDIHLSNLGTDPEGITGRELTERVLSAVVRKTLEVVSESGGDLDKIGESALKQLEASGNEDAAGAIRTGIDIFKKMQE